MKKVNNLVVLGTVLLTGVVTYKITTNVLGKLVPKKDKKENNDNIVNFDDYKEIELLDYENPKVERQYIRIDFDEESLEQENQKKLYKFQGKC